MAGPISRLSVPEWLTTQAEGTNTMGESAHDTPLVEERLEGQILDLTHAGWRQVRSVERACDAVHLAGTRVALRAENLINTGAAICLETGRNLGQARVVTSPPPEPAWFDRGERTATTALLSRLGGEREIFPLGAIDGSRLALEPPGDFSKDSAASRRYAAELAFIAFSEADDAVHVLEARGFKEVKWFERAQALAFTCVSPDERAVIVAFRGAGHFRTLAAALDQRQLDIDGGEPVSRGPRRYTQQIAEPVLEEAERLLARYPEARWLATGGSLGGCSALLWADAAVRHGGSLTNRIGQVIAFGAAGSLGPERFDALQALSGARVRAVIVEGDPFPERLGLTRALGERVTRLRDDRPAVESTIPFGSAIQTALRAHRLGTALRILKTPTPSVGFARRDRKIECLAEPTKKQAL